MLAASRPTLFCCIVRLSIYDVPHRIGFAPLPLPIWWLGVLVAHQNSADLRALRRAFSASKRAAFSKLHNSQPTNICDVPHRFDLHLSLYLW